ncbi:MAG TPA: ABC transporter permease [Thermoplasmata archaeon]|nr:ABC transporter permease [Thermoplasmata archaeon]
MDSGVPAAAGPAEPPRRRPRRTRISDFDQWTVVTVHQIAHYVRTYRFLGLLGFVLAVSTLTLLFQLDAGGALVRQQQLYKSSEYLSNFLDWTGLWVILAAGFFGGEALSVDFSTGAGYYMLVQPVRRGTLLAGRYAAATVAILAIVGAYYGVAILGATYFFGASAILWGTVAYSLAIAVVYALSALSVAFCFSAFFRSPAIGQLVTILTLYVGFVTLQSVVELAGLEPWWSLTYAGGAMAAALDTDFVHLQAVPVGEDQYLQTWSASTTEGLVIMTAYLAIFLILSILLYHQKESTG